MSSSTTARQAETGRPRSAQAEGQPSPVAGLSPIPQHYLVPGDFFQHQPRTGTIVSALGQPTVRASQQFFPALAAALESEVGDASGEILYRCGLAWGRAEMASFVPRVEKEFATPFDKLNMGPMLEAWWWPFRVGGWGRWNYDFRHSNKGVIAVDLYGSALVTSAGRHDRPTCGFYAGLFASIFSRLAGRDLAAAELECAAMGAPRCRFVVSTEPRVRLAQDRRGDEFDAIVQRLVTSK